MLCALSLALLLLFACASLSSIPKILSVLQHGVVVVSIPNTNKDAIFLLAACVFDTSSYYYIAMVVSFVSLFVSFSFVVYSTTPGISAPRSTHILHAGLAAVMLL